ncbi:LysM peptidoglycan-binding domain-containing protein [Streptomyces platensis]|uniref:LysM peptidoglycan-binding domain-containing protein n=1 Tax=Streptomyces platensis TaxID=58346 RepID=UPI00378964D0
MAHPTPGPMRATGRLLRALLGLLVLLALIGGVPFLLLALGHQPTELTGGLDALLRPDDGTLFLVVLTLIGWAGWAAFTLSAVIELVAVLRHRSAPRLKGLGGLQSFAGFLIGGLVLLAPTAASAATPQAATAAVTAPHTTTEGHQLHRAGAPSTPTAADTSAQAGPQHTVTASREELWDLAERYLGRGERWRDIAALNPQYPHLATSGAHRGMVINLPADARTSPPAQEQRAASPASAKAGSHAETHETTYTVEAGDSLSGIADEQLGDADRWHDIYEGNRDTISDPNLIYPGQHVDLPGRKAQPPHADRDDAPQPAPDKPAPHKDHSAAPTAPHKDSSAGAPDRQAPEHHDSSSTHRQDARPDHSPAAPAPSSPSPSTPDVPAPHGSAEAETAQPDVHVADEEQALAPATVWAGAGVLAAALIGTLATRRVLQQRRRKPGHRIPMPEGSAAETERRLRSVQHSGFDLLNAALRALASHLADAGRDLPDLDAVVLHDARLDLHLARQAPPCAPFTAMPGQPHVWTCTAAHPSLSEDHSDMDAPYPALVSLGWDDGGRLVLVDLERIGVLNLTGDPHLAQSVLQGLAVELATASVHGPLDVTVVDATAPGLDDVVPERVARSESLAQITTQLTAHATDQRRSLTDLGARGLGEARLHEDSGGAWTPHVVLAQDLTGDPAALFNALEAAPRTASAVIVAAPTDVPLPDTAWTLNCGGPEQSVTLPGSGLAIHIQGLDDAVYADALELLRVAASSITLPSPVPTPAGPVTAEDDEQTTDASKDEQPADTSGADGAGLPAEYADDEDEDSEGEPDVLEERTAAADPQPATEPVDTSTTVAAGPADTAPVGAAQACTATPTHLTVSLPQAATAVQDSEDPAAAAPDILLLGPVSLTGATGRYDSAREAPSTELAVFLYLNPDVDHHAIDAALWPTSTVHKSMRTSVVSRLRSWLGQDADGHYYFPRLQDTEGHRYRLSPSVTCDWTTFQRFAAAGLHDMSEDGDLALRRALSLVRGRPFSAVDRQRYSWAEPLMQEMCEAIVDVALELSDRLREAGDITGALWAANRGLLAAEESEPLHRALFRAHHKAGDTTALREAAARLVRINDQLGGEGVDMDTETAQLLRDLLPRTRQTTS